MEKDLNNISLNKLRAYAKLIGVKSPTIYTKSVLISKIKRIQDGTDKPVFNNRGRPSLNTLQTNDIKASKEFIEQFNFTKKDLNKIIKDEKKIEEIEALIDNFKIKLLNILKK